MDESKDEAEIARMIEEAEGDPKYWLSRTPQERIQALLLMTERVYGYEAIHSPMKKVIKVIRRDDT